MSDKEEKCILSSLRMPINLGPLVIQDNQPWTKEDQERAEKELMERTMTEEEVLQFNADAYVDDLQEIVSMIDQKQSLDFIKTRLEQAIKLYREDYINSYKD